MNKPSIESITDDWILNKLESSDDIFWKLNYSKWEALNLIKKQIWQYQMWFEEHQPTIMASEVMMWHPDVPYAGTADLILKIHNKQQNQDIIMLADLKTGTEQEKHFEQCMAYAILFEKIYKKKISALGVLYCNGKHRGELKPGKLKTKIVRNKSGALTDTANFLINRVECIYKAWKSNQKYEQPTRKLVLPKKFELNINKKEEE